MKLTKWEKTGTHLWCRRFENGCVAIILHKRFDGWFPWLYYELDPFERHYQGRCRNAKTAKQDVDRFLDRMLKLKSML